MFSDSAIHMDDQDTIKICDSKASDSFSHAVSVTIMGYRPLDYVKFQIVVHVYKNDKHR